VRAAHLADQAAKALTKEGAVVAGKANAWLVVQEKSVRSLVALAARLRISPQQRFDRERAGTSAREGMPEAWYCSAPDERGLVFDPTDPEALLAGHRPATAKEFLASMKPGARRRN
jgi:hypothetical protein